jgi:hypothetical protein
MLIEVIKHYEVEAPNEETAKQIIAKLEERNQQGLFLKWVSANRTDRAKSIWSLW